MSEEFGDQVAVATEDRGFLLEALHDVEDSGKCCSLE